MGWKQYEQDSVSVQREQSFVPVAPCPHPRVEPRVGFMANNQKVYFLKCMSCPGRRSFMKRAEFVKMLPWEGRIFEEDIPVQFDNRGSEEFLMRECERCQEFSRTQRHHWAPRHLFNEEADEWPMADLCQACHTRWHQIVTPYTGWTD